VCVKSRMDPRLLAVSCPSERRTTPAMGLFCIILYNSLMQAATGGAVYAKSERMGTHVCALVMDRCPATRTCSPG
jgi:hypothetical protein